MTFISISSKNRFWFQKRYRKRPETGLSDRKLAMNVTESKEGSLILGCNMSHDRDGLEAGVPERKDCLRHDSNNPEHPKLSCDDPDECASDNGDKDKTQTAKQI